MIQTKRGIKRLEATKRANAVKRSSALASSQSLDGNKKKDIEMEFYNQTISEMFCSLRVKMKELTFNVTCSPMVELREQHINMKIKIKRSDSDQSIEDAR